MVAKFVPNRGAIVWLNFNPGHEHEQTGKRPALVLSPKSYNQKTGLMLACPITSKIKHYPFEVRVKTQHIDGVVLADQIKSLDWQAREASLADIASAATVSRVQEFVSVLLKG
jgi:mRNA interferase MazF